MWSRKKSHCLCATKKRQVGNKKRPFLVNVSMRECDAHRKGPRKSFVSKAAVCVEKTAVWKKESGASDFHHQAHQAGFGAQKRPNIGFCLFAVLLGFINGRLYYCWMSHCADFGFPDSQAGVCTIKRAFCTTKRAFVLPSRCFVVQTGE
jgi:hypothetical protein